ncbi:MAG: hypothetical protein EXX96DRAFT_56789 [Benjaminiella poitrasii]|nr:MAG: hypothetical protein EXX96DRAFT_56789 [Benjaminiella poitrasii]
MATRKSSIHPRPTKASMLRLQKQHSTDTGGSLKTTETHVDQSFIRSRPSSKAHNGVGPSEGVKAFMAQQRARMSKTQQTASEEKRPSSKVMTGAQRYGSKQTIDKPQTSQRKIQIIVKQAKATGKLNISSRGLTNIPEEVLKMHHSDPNSVIDFSSLGDAWYDAVDLVKLIASNNAITEIDERLAHEFGALKQIDR